MPIKNLLERMKMGRVDGGVLVGRQLVHAYVKDPKQFAETAELARYAQLLCAKLKLSVLDAHKIVMAAWLSALHDRRDLSDPLIQQYHLENIVGSVDGLAQLDGEHIGSQILSLIMGYQALAQRNPAIRKKLPAIKNQLRELWALTPERQKVLNKFMLILRDERFLFSLETPSARVLIVDPTEVISTALTLPLRSQRYEVDAVGNVPDAESALEEEIPDLIIVEQKLPLENGLELCRKLRDKPETRELPIIMLTKSKSQRIARDCIKAGADDVVIRPIDMELFFIKIRKLLEVKGPTLTPEGVRGTLKDISLTDVIQLFSAGCKSVVVRIESNGKLGLIYIQEGEIVEARYEKEKGEEAFYRLMGWKDGTFVAESCDEYPERTMQAPAMSLLMEAARRNDEASRSGEEAV